MLHLPSVQVAPLAPRWLPPELKRKLLHTLAVRVWKLFVLENPQTKQLDVSKLHITCIFQRTFRPLASSAEQKTLNVILILKCRQTGGGTLWLLELQSSGFSGVTAGAKAALSAHWQLQITIYQLLLRVCCFSCKLINWSRPDLNIQTVRSLRFEPDGWLTGWVRALLPAFIPVNTINRVRRYSCRKQLL